PGNRTALRYRDSKTSPLWVEPIVVPAGPPRFATASAKGHTVGLIIGDEATGGRCAFVPGCGELSPSLLEKLEQTDLLLFDGTFWSNNELIELGISDRTAREMDHLPVSGPDGSLARLSAIDTRRVYTHINNSNPMLLEDSPERSAVAQAGILVGADGMSFTL
ncbi:MAG TPA: MBL fold metallo-hydrolase, partial [Gemmatimonadales bacterium]|nr:MBL fold metallo-hydrolase [Gemmatimonadales bacterium]